MQEQYGNGGSYLLTVVSLVFAWLAQVSIIQMASIISLLSGVLACISFGLRIVSDWQKLKKKSKDERVVEKPE